MDSLTETLVIIATMVGVTIVLDCTIFGLLSFKPPLAHVVLDTVEGCLTVFGLAGLAVGMAFCVATANPLYLLGGLVLGVLTTLIAYKCYASLTNPKPPKQ